MNAAVQVTQKEFIGKQAKAKPDLRQENRKYSVEHSQEYREYAMFMQQMNRANNNIIDTTVKNFQRQDLGNIKDVVFDAEMGHIVYAVIAFGGVLGLSDKLFAVPWKALRWTGDDTYYVLNIDKTSLKKAPEFDKHKWSDSSKSSNMQRDELNQFYGVNY